MKRTQIKCRTLWSEQPPRGRPGLVILVLEPCVCLWLSSLRNSSATFPIQHPATPVLSWEQLEIVYSPWCFQFGWWGQPSVAFYSAIFSSSHSFPGCLGLWLLCTHAVVAPVLTCSTAISVRFRLFIMVFRGIIVSCGIWSMNFVRAMIIK